MKGSNNKIRVTVKRFSRNAEQASLFHYIKETPDPSIWSDIDWSFLRHPFRTFAENWRAPRPTPSLFHYTDKALQKPFTFKEFLGDLFSGFRNPLFIPSVFSSPDGMLKARAQFRTRKMESDMLSIVIHLAVVGLVFIIIHQGSLSTDAKEDNVIYINNPIVAPYLGDGRDGGGGGGGGKGQQAPPATGRMPETSRVQLMAPDPENPQPLMPAEDLLAQVASVQMPIDIPQDQSLPIGDIAPPNGSLSSGSGIGGGIGTGTGTGVGSGSGPGVGPGSGGGMGGGSGGGIGSGVGPYVAGDGVSSPTAIVQPLPPYTEDARKARVTGVVLIEAVVRKNGTADNIRVIRGLGYGLDESAVHTIATKWRFRPGTKNGLAVDVIAEIEVTFNMY
jgi:protein TonB